MSQPGPERALVQRSANVVAKQSQDQTFVPPKKLNNYGVCSQWVCFSLHRVEQYIRMPSSMSMALRSSSFLSFLASIARNNNSDETIRPERWTMDNRPNWKNIYNMYIFVYWGWSGFSAIFRLLRPQRKKLREKFLRALYAKVVQRKKGRRQRVSTRKGKM